LLVASGEFIAEAERHVAHISIIAFALFTLVPLVLLMPAQPSEKLRVRFFFIGLVEIFIILLSVAMLIPN
jgi:hypothetical protein